MQLTKNRAGAVALLLALGRVAAAHAAVVAERSVSVLHATHGVAPHDDGSDSGDDGGGDDGGDGDDRSVS